MTIDTGETIGVAGSVAKIAQGSAGGNVTVEAFTTSALVDLVANDSGETTAAAGSVALLSRALLSGDGSDVVTLTFTVDGSPVVGATVWVTTDQAGNNVVTGTSATNASGQVVFNLTAGNVYYQWVTGGTPPVTLTGADSASQFTAVAD